MPSKSTDFSGRSDYGAFIANGIPAGGLFTGAEGFKTAAEAAIWGGTAGQSCEAIAHTVLQLPMNTEVVNGPRGKGNFKCRRTMRTTTTATQRAERQGDLATSCRGVAATVIPSRAPEVLSLPVALRLLLTEQPQIVARRCKSRSASSSAAW